MNSVAPTSGECRGYLVAVTCASVEARALALRLLPPTGAIRSDALGGTVYTYRSPEPVPAGRFCDPDGTLLVSVSCSPLGLADPPRPGSDRRQRHRPRPARCRKGGRR